jgi:hypothetical protein
MRHRIRIGTAGWNVPAAQAEHFPPEGTHLARYAAVFSAAEINSCFHRPHRPATYARWAATVPEDFRFAVKVPKEVTHALRLVDAEAPLARFLDEVGALGGKLGPLLLQLPPSLGFDAGVLARFLDLLRARFDGALVCVSRPTRRPYPVLPAPVALPSRATGGCMARRACITPPIRRNGWIAWPPCCAKPMRRAGCSSTTPPNSRRRAMRWR